MTYLIYRQSGQPGSAAVLVARAANYRAAKTACRNAVGVSRGSEDGAPGFVDWALYAAYSGGDDTAEFAWVERA